MDNKGLIELKGNFGGKTVEVTLMDDWSVIQSTGFAKPKSWPSLKAATVEFGSVDVSPFVAWKPKLGCEAMKMVIISMGTPEIRAKVAACCMAFWDDKYMMPYFREKLKANGGKEAAEEVLLQTLSAEPVSVDVVKRAMSACEIAFGSMRFRMEMKLSAEFLRASKSLRNDAETKEFLLSKAVDFAGKEEKGVALKELWYVRLKNGCESKPSDDQIAAMVNSVREKGDWSRPSVWKYFNEEQLHSCSSSACMELMDGTLQGSAADCMSWASRSEKNRPMFQKVVLNWVKTAKDGRSLEYAEWLDPKYPESLAWVNALSYEDRMRVISESRYKSHYDVSELLDARLSKAAVADEWDPSLKTDFLEAMKIADGNGAKAGAIGAKLKNAMLASSKNGGRKIVEAVAFIAWKRGGGFSGTAYGILKNIGSTRVKEKMMSKLASSSTEKDAGTIANEILALFPEEAESVKTLLSMMGYGNAAKEAVEMAEMKSKFATSSECSVRVIGKGAIRSVVLRDKAAEIRANTLYMAVGFAFSSGVDMMKGLMEDMKRINGKTELTVGAIKPDGTPDAGKRMGKKTAMALADLRSELGVRIFTRKDEFFHGKFYYLAGKDRIVAMVGSSNMSKTAYLNNYELDMLVEAERGSATDQAILRWYEEFKSGTVEIGTIDPEAFGMEDFDTPKDNRAKNHSSMSMNEIRNEMEELTDEEAQERWNELLKRNPDDVFDADMIPAFTGLSYRGFFFEGDRTCVFESKMPGNARYQVSGESSDSVIAELVKAGDRKGDIQALDIYKSREYHVRSDKMDDSNMQTVDRRENVGSGTSKTEYDGMKDFDWKAMKGKHKRPVAVSYFDGDYVPVNSWKEVFVTTLNLMCDDYEELIRKAAVNGDDVREKKPVKPEIRNIRMSMSSKGMQTAIRLKNGVYVEACLSADRIVVALRSVFDYCNMDADEVSIKYN